MHTTSTSPFPLNNIQRIFAVVVVLVVVVVIVVVVVVIVVVVVVAVIRGDLEMYQNSFEQTYEKEKRMKNYK